MEPAYIYKSHTLFSSIAKNSGPNLGVPVNSRIILYSGKPSLESILLQELPLFRRIRSFGSLFFEQGSPPRFEFPETMLALHFACLMLDDLVPLARIDLYRLGSALLGGRNRLCDRSPVLIGRHYDAGKGAILHARSVMQKPRRCGFARDGMRYEEDRTAKNEDESCFERAGFEMARENRF